MQTNNHCPHMLNSQLYSPPELLCDLRHSNAFECTQLHKRSPSRWLTLIVVALALCSAFYLIKSALS